MITDMVVKSAVARLERLGGPMSDELAALLLNLLVERNQAYRNGQRTMLDKVAIAARVPQRRKCLDHWNEDMSHSDAFDLGAVSAAGVIHKKLSELASVRL